MCLPARNNDAALAAFLAAKEQIDTLLARLQELSDDHFNTEPGKVTWADAGTLSHFAHQLANICDQACGEGEYARP